MRKTRRFKALLLTGVLMAAMCLPTFAAFYHTGEGTATTFLGNVYIDNYIYYSSNTSTELKLVSVVYMIEHEIDPPTSDYSINDIATLVTESPSMAQTEFYDYNLDIQANTLTRIEIPTGGTFTKGSGSASTSYVLVRPRVALAAFEWQDLEIPTQYVGYDVFFWRDSITKSFHQ